MSRRGFRLPSFLRWPAQRMEGKLLIVFLFLIILPIGILSYVSALRYSDSIERNTAAYVTQLTDKTMGKLDDYIADMRKISIIPSYLDAIQAGLKMSNQYYEGRALPEENVPSLLPGDQQRTIDIQRKIGSSIYFLNNIKQGTNTVYLFDRFGNVYYAVKSSGIRSDLRTVYPKWREMAAEAHGAPVLVSTQEVGEWASGKRYVFTVVRQIIDPSTYEPLGMIAVDANIGVIESIVRDMDDTTSGTTLIVDDGGKVIYDSGRQYLGQTWPENDLLRQTAGPEGSFRAASGGERVLTIYKQSEVTGWKALVAIPERTLTAEARLIRNQTLVFATLIVGFALLISLVSAFALTRPLRSLVRLMKKVQKGNLDVVFPVVRRDEIGLVGSAFNRMIDRVKLLIADIYAMEQRKKEAELQSLQQQINPHFIYNTLESIRMTAVLHDDDEVGDMAQLLGKLLRYSIHAGKETVPLAREWEHLRMYVKLLNYRYSDRFALELPEAEEPIQVMKLLFQPIVENAVYHGLDESKPHLRIRIESRVEGADRLFAVADDGGGMEPDTLLRLRSSLNRPPGEWDGRGIGLRNVHERLKLRYGEAYGLAVDSEPGRGTVVTVRLPAG
ncbi:cache domain-containing sensor histidine kinase [Cohnella massiliensis]|uniref:cache domain-containing sensor histidine kinase n=1 Tax=Cohnella massiliensis TaxID=1816691 RepID=UPI0009BC16A1|nr:sensor histidine kinase [Cohnella massiliensis]